jgi:hypothetical protein
LFAEHLGEVLNLPHTNRELIILSIEEKRGIKREEATIRRYNLSARDL